MPLIDEAKKEYQKKWREENAEHVSAMRKKWADEHQAEILEYRKAYRKTPKGAAIRKSSSAKRYAEMSESERKRRIFSSARGNASSKNREFSITMSDVVWNVYCPVLGIKLNYGKPTKGKLSWDSPSLDRADPGKGYIPGNVVVMSWRANHIKMDSTLQELRSLISYLTSKENSNG
jgi:hypothetical protein